MAQQDLRSEIVAKLDVQKFRLRKNNPIILLFGGRLEEQADSNRFPIISVRDGLIRRPNAPSWLLSATRIAENYQDWLHFNQYEDLISFEKHLASICSLIAIVVESPGAIAELGAFTQIEDVAKKMCVFVTKEHNASSSFISLGLLKPLSAHNRVHVYPWNEKNHQTISDELLVDITSDLESHLHNLPAEPKFDKNVPGHVMLLISELLRLFLALKEQEILHYLMCLGIPINQRAVNQYLYTLCMLQLIKKHQYSDKIFFTHSPKDQPYAIRLSTKPEHPEQIDDTQIIADVRNYYRQAAKENHRNRLINSIFGKGDHEHS